MTDETPLTPGRRFGKRRRQNGAPHRVQVSMNDVERAKLLKAESDSGRSASQILVSTFMDSDGHSTTEDRRAVLAELLITRQHLAAIGNNLNQLSRHANATMEFPREASETLREIRAQLTRTRSILDELS